METNEAYAVERQPSNDGEAPESLGLDGETRSQGRSSTIRNSGD